MRLPKTFLTWMLRRPENMNEISIRMERYALEERQTFDGSKWKGVPCYLDGFDGTDIHVHVFVDHLDHSYERVEATIRMGQKIELPYTVWIYDPKYDPLTLTLELEWPKQESLAFPLEEQAHRIASERDWSQFVLEQCKDVAKESGRILLDRPGSLIVKIGRNYQSAEELFKQYEATDFCSRFESDIKASSSLLADVTCIAVQAEVYFESEPTEWEHTAYGLSYDDYRMRTRDGHDVLEYDVIPIA